MQDWAIALFIFAAVTVGMIGQGWVSMLEHQRRRQAMDIIKAAMEAGKEAPPIVYEQLRQAGQSKPPWSEVVVFSALAFGFWLAFSQADGSQRTAYLVIAATMTVTALGCVGLALMRPGEASRKDDDDK